jgi:hypothetical protein
MGPLVFHVNEVNLCDKMPLMTTARFLLTTVVWMTFVLPNCFACPTQKANVARKPEPKTTRFAIMGKIDIDDDGQSDLKLLRQLIVANGAVIDAQLDVDGRATGQLRATTDYLLIGETPDKSAAPSRVIRQFDDFLRRAKELRIQVVHLDRLFQWGTRHRRAEMGGEIDDGSSTFRERRPPLRGVSDYE